MQNIEEQLKLLVELQQLDVQVYQCERTLKEIPVQLRALDDEFKQKTTLLNELEESVKKLQLSRKEKELDLEAREGNIKKLKSQQYQVKTNKEYTAIQTEIERAKADNSVLEEEIIKILDAIDAEHKKSAAAKEQLKKEEVALGAKKKEKQEEARKVESQLKTLQVQRGELAAKVEKNVLSKYERLLKSREGVAIVPIRGDACQGCNRILPPQVINETKMKKELITCEYCTRMLYCED